jgi:hypothetical protein
MVTHEPKQPDSEQFKLTYSEYLSIKRKLNDIEGFFSFVGNLIYFLSIFGFSFFIFFFFNGNKFLRKLDVFLIICFITLSISTNLELRAKVIALFTGKLGSVFYKKINKYSNFIQFQSALLDYEYASREHKSYLEAQLKTAERAKQKAELEEKRKQWAYWTSIDPYDFEHEIALLFEKNGYIAKVTKGSKDGGIDILLTKNTIKGIAQCKRHKTKAGPATVRDLYGTMVHGKYDFGFIICPAGFSTDAYNFSRNKSIKLIGLKKILEMNSGNFDS